MTMLVSPQQGRPGSTVTVHLQNLTLPCEIAFDGQVMVSRSVCVPGPDGTGTFSFTVPSSASPGSHQITATAWSARRVEQSSTTFRVRGPAVAPSPSPSPNRAASTPRPSPSPTRRPSPSPTRAASPTPSPSPVDEGVEDQAAQPAAECTLHPAMVRMLTVTPESGPPGSDAVVTISWANQSQPCPEARGRLTLDGRAVRDSVPAATSPTSIMVRIPENLSPGVHDIELRGMEGGEALLATTVFEVTPPPTDRWTWLALLAVLIAAAVLARPLLRSRMRSLRLPFRRFGRRG